MDLLELNLPDRGSTQSVEVNLRPQVVQNWLANLPLASPLQTGQKLLDQLRLLNQAAIPPEDRFRTLEALAQASDDACVQIKKAYMEGGLPLSERLYGQALLVQQLMHALADGYKITVMDKLLANVQLGNLEAMLHDQTDRTLLQAIQRAMIYLGRTLVEHYLVYAVEPAGIWQDLHRLYVFSEKHLLHLLNIDEVRKKQRTANAAPIIQAYKQIVLLSLCNPYHLLQGEAELLYRHMSGWAQQVKLLRIEDAKSLQGSFVLYMDKDIGPRYLPRNQKTKMPSIGRMIDVANLLKLLTLHIDTLRGKSTPQGIKVAPTLAQRMEIDMYVRLKRIWSVRLDRLSQRSEMVDQISLVMGLSACHHFISEGAEFAPDRSEVSLSRGDASGSLSNLSLQPLYPAQGGGNRPFQPQDGEPREEDNVWLQVYANPAHEDLGGGGTAARSPTFKESAWRQRNISLGGLSLYCIRDCGLRVRVGELVAFHPARHRDDPWQVGIIRWLRAQEAIGVELGIMSLAPDALPVGVRAVEGVGAGGDYTRALLVPNLDPSSHPTSLITPAAIYDIGTVLVMNMGDRLLHVRLKHLVESTRSFSQYRFDIEQRTLGLSIDRGHEGRKERHIR